MSEYVTLFIRKPQDPTNTMKVQEALEALRPFQTGMSLEDEMTVLEMIEQHPEFDETIAEDARRQTAELHARAAA